MPPKNTKGKKEIKSTKTKTPKTQARSAKTKSTKAVKTQAVGSRKARTKTVKKVSKSIKKKSPDSVIVVLPDIDDIDLIDDEEEEVEKTSIEIPWLEKFKPKERSPARPHGNNVEYLVTAKPLLELLLSPSTNESRQTASPADRSQYAFSKFLHNKYMEYKEKYRIDYDKDDPISELIDKLNIGSQVEASLYNLQDESICYICNQKIAGKIEKKSTRAGIVNTYQWKQGEMEAEHILPFAYAAQYSCIPSKSMLANKHLLNIDDDGNLVINLDRNDPNVRDNKLIIHEDNVVTILTDNDIFLNKWQLLLSLLEMRVSHKCCNQVKKASLFIKRDQELGNLYILNNDIVNFFNAIVNEKSYGCPRIIEKSPLKTKNGRNKLINQCVDTYFLPVVEVINDMENTMKNDWYKFDKRVYPCNIYDEDSKQIKREPVVPSLQNIKKGSNEWSSFIEWNRLIRISNFFNYMPQGITQDIKGNEKYKYQQPYEIRDATINLINEKICSIRDIKLITEELTKYINNNFINKKIEYFNVEKIIKYLENDGNTRVPKRLNILIPKFISSYLNNIIVDNNIINTSIYIFSQIYSKNVNNPIVSGIPVDSYKDELLSLKNDVQKIIAEIITVIIYHKLLQEELIIRNLQYEQRSISNELKDFNIIGGETADITYMQILHSYTNPINNSNNVYLANAFLKADKLIETVDKINEAQKELESNEKVNEIYEAISQDDKSILDSYYNNKYQHNPNEHIDNSVNLKEICEDSYVNEDKNIDFTKKHRQIIKQGERNMQRMLEQQQRNNPRGPSIMNQDSDILTAAQDLLGLRKTDY